jgi:hypothetical protein
VIVFAEGDEYQEFRRWNGDDEFYTRGDHMKLTTLILTVALIGPAAAADKKQDILGFSPGMSADTVKERLAALHCDADFCKFDGKALQVAAPRVRASGLSAIASRPRSSPATRSRQRPKNTASSPASRTSATSAMPWADMKTRR